MEQFIEFIGNHLIITTLFLIVAAMLAQNFYAEWATGANIGPQQATELINRESALVVDVRPIGDFNQGHILGARNIPLNSLVKQPAQLEKHKAESIIISCRSGAQSSMACKQLRKQGYDKVYNLRGGILAWQNAGMPVTKK